jgi:hypothetical protein
VNAAGIAMVSTFVMFFALFAFWVFTAQGGVVVT